ncbi:MAG: General secretion pathway protein G-like protein [Parcubacteria group bacterium GW2011_GWA1_43_21]|nr:MAG: General secretion pathway protein G-like protein [Parcubacteria group bacterium GW2011_GWB1_42_9]KKT09421.1 MAG: General secretion pathway protein G-like protein [Parcubacteria group bacterium GW2011_GWA1_43_21]
MKNSKKLGFTLIELLVVIAIIGILSGIISVQLSASRQKAKGAAVKQEMTNLRNVMGVIMNTNNTWIPLSFCSDSGFQNQWGDIVKNSGGTAFVGTVICSGKYINNTPNVACSSSSGMSNYTACYGFQTSGCSGANCSKYVAIASISADRSKWWCVDSSNQGKELTDGQPGFNVATFDPSAVSNCP